MAVGDSDVQLMIWDLEGIDRYCGFNPRYLRGASAFIIVMDQTRSQSLVEGMEIFEMARDHTNIPCLMVVNKCDIDSHGIGIPMQLMNAPHTLHLAFTPAQKLEKTYLKCSLH